MNILEKYNELLEVAYPGNTLREKSPDDETLAWMLDKIEHHKHVKIVEFGTYSGYTAGLLSMALHTPIITFDPSPQKTLKLICDVFSYVIHITGTSDNALSTGTRYDVVIIDGDHKYYSAKRDYFNALRIIDENALIFFDNLQHGEQCGLAFNEIKGNKEKSPNGSMGVVIL